MKSEGFPDHTTRGEGLMKTAFAVVVFVFAVLAALSDARGEPSVSGSTEECIGCHVSTHPGIVEGWKRSRHAATTPAEAMKVSGRARKISSGDVPEDLKNVAVGCAECHLMRPRAHTDTFEHNGYDVHVVVSPQDCAVCHVVETEQYGRNLMAHAYGNLVNNDVYKMLISAVNDTPVMDKGRLAIQPSNAATDAESCLYCHGTRLEVTGKQTRETTVGEMEFPVIAGWPNGGVGRVNLDGSVGSCSACHTRHEFSISMARKPYTCKECHVGPDVPAYKVYEASKHGNIYSAKYQDWNFKNVPWTAGKDFTAPTCAVCHISEVVGLDGEIVSKRTHEVKDRLPWRIFGLIYAHPHPRDADTSVIRNQQGLPLPTDFGGGIAANYLMNEQERAEAQKALDIRVVIGNPPYSAGQGSTNDDNANIAYPSLDSRISSTYARMSNATNKNRLYDSYIRAVRWASDRVGDKGIVAFVSNGGFIDSSSADGLRKTLVNEFSEIFVLNLRGNQRTAGEQSRREGGKIFGSGSRAKSPALK